MRVLICGSRKPPDPFRAKLLVDQIVERLPPGAVVINGGADGIDKAVILSIRQNRPESLIKDFGTVWPHVSELGILPLTPYAAGVTVWVLRANWKAHSKRAGPIRNRAMLDLQPEFVCALWDGRSPGTADTVLEARRRGIETSVIRL